MAIGDIKQFGMLKVTDKYGNYSYYESNNAGYTSVLDYRNINTFTYMTASNVISAPLNWMECQYNGQQCYIAFDIFMSYMDVADVLSQEKKCTIDNKQYEIKLMPVDFWTGLPSSVVTQLHLFMTWTSTYRDVGKGYVMYAQRNAGETSIYTNFKSDSTRDPNTLFVPVLVQANAAPTISGSDTFLGEKIGPFSVTYQISDTDGGQELTVTERLNGTTIKTLKNPTQNTVMTLSVSEQMFSNLAVGTSNQIEIEVSDGSATAYRRYTFIKTNSAPIIKYNGNLDLGELIQKPTITYQVSDNEADAITVVEKLNGVTINTFTASQNTDYTVGLTDLFWQTCGIDTNEVEIIVSDSSGGSNSKTIYFSRKVTKVQIITAEALKTDQAASRILLSVQWTTENCTCKAEVCNNGLDANPVWEDATSMVLASRPYTFQNTTKTADKWGIKIRLTVVKNEGYTGEAAIYGFGGAYE